MDPQSHALPLPAGIPGMSLALVQELIPRMEPADERLEAGLARWRGELLRLTAALGIQAERREDVLQEVYLAARQKCPQLASEIDLRRWLFRVTANQCRLEHRKRKRWGRVFEALAFWRGPAANEDSTRSAERGELTTQVETALGRLTGVEREIVVLRYFCDFDSGQIGEMLSLPAATVRSHLAKARKQLARDLADWKD